VGNSHVKPGELISLLERRKRKVLFTSNWIGERDLISADVQGGDKVTNAAEMNAYNGRQSDLGRKGISDVKSGN